MFLRITSTTNGLGWPLSKTTGFVNAETYLKDTRENLTVRFASRIYADTGCGLTECFCWPFLPLIKLEFNCRALDNFQCVLRKVSRAWCVETKQSKTPSVVWIHINSLLLPLNETVRTERANPKYLLHSNLLERFWIKATMKTTWLLLWPSGFWNLWHQ